MSKILIVEDDLDYAQTVKCWLVLQNYEVDIIGNGSEALVRLFVSKYDLILLDWRLPGLSGLDICKRYRERGSKTPIVFLTCLGRIEDKCMALEAGGDDYLVKPIEPRELLARVRALLRRPPYPARPNGHFSVINEQYIVDQEGGKTSDYS